MTGESLLTTMVGSYPLPEWLIDREALLERTVPRVRQSGLWRISDEYLEQAHHDATLLAIRDLERAGVDVITDGEIRREAELEAFRINFNGCHSLDQLLASMDLFTREVRPLVER